MADKFIDLIADPDVAIDLGTANTRLFATGKGLVVDEPTVTGAGCDRAIVKSAGAFGPGSVESIEFSAGTVMPLRSGVVVDVQATVSLLKQHLRRAKRFGLGTTRAIACTPTDASATEVVALSSAVRRAGISGVKVIPEPLAAAVGAGLDVSTRYAQAIIDFGAGVTDIAVIRSGALIHTEAVRLGCSDLYPAVGRMVARRYGVIISVREAERLTKEVGFVRSSDTAMAASPPRGYSKANGREMTVSVEGENVFAAVRPMIEMILDRVRETFRRLPPDVAAEVIESGVCLTGGGALLPGIRELIAEATSLEVRVAPDPLRAVINGASQMLAVGKKTELWNLSALGTKRRLAY